MTAITQIATDNRSAIACETVAITNHGATSSVSKALKVPVWANYATLVIDNLTMGGTSPLFDFTVRTVNITANATPDDGDLILLGGWDGITQKTSASATNTTIDIGPLITVDDSGSATASDRYGVQAVLPHWLVYTYTLDGTTQDEDYAFTISAYFRK